MPSTRPDPAQNLAFLIGRLSESVDEFRSAVGQLEAANWSLRQQVAVQHDQLQFLLKRTHDLNTTAMAQLKLLTGIGLTPVGDGLATVRHPAFTLEEVQHAAAEYAVACAIDRGVKASLIREAQRAEKEVAKQAVESVDPASELKN
jgi:non-ribosomal peptide synthetase component F